jgi:hypothetical protein
MAKVFGFMCPWCGAVTSHLRGDQGCTCNRRVRSRKDWPKTVLAGQDLARLDIRAKREEIREEGDRR